MYGDSKRCPITGLPRSDLTELSKAIRTAIMTLPESEFESVELACVTIGIEQRSEGYRIVIPVLGCETVVSDYDLVETKALRLIRNTVEQHDLNPFTLNDLGIDDYQNQPDFQTVQEWRRIIL